MPSNPCGCSQSRYSSSRSIVVSPASGWARRTRPPASWMRQMASACPAAAAGAVTRSRPRREAEGAPSATCPPEREDAPATGRRAPQGRAGRLQAPARPRSRGRTRSPAGEADPLGDRAWISTPGTTAHPSLSRPPTGNRSSPRTGVVVGQRRPGDPGAGQWWATCSGEMVAVAHRRVAVQVNSNDVAAVSRGRPSTGHLVPGRRVHARPPDILHEMPGHGGRVDNSPPSDTYPVRPVRDSRHSGRRPVTTHGRTEHRKRGVAGHGQRGSFDRDGHQITRHQR